MLLPYRLIRWKTTSLNLSPSYGASSHRFVATVSSLFQPITLAPKGAQLKREENTAKSQQLLFEMGIVRQASPGMFTFLPLGLRALNKLKKLVEKELNQIGCQKLSLPTLTHGNLWKTTGRWESTGPELMTVQDRHNHPYVLSPTHEEAITDLVATLPTLTHKQLPLKLYQITSKFRDEIKPRFGLLRGREFIMKDLYTFDQNLEQAQETYRLVCHAYDRIFEQLGVPFVKVVGATGNIGGLSSHEYHFPAPIGEDVLKICTSCQYGANAEIFEGYTCPRSDCTMKESKGIEVGHTFLLGTKYSQTLQAFFTNSDGLRSVCQMGCYGIGVSRIVAASVEALCLDGEIRWPHAIAPYSVCIVTPKKGSREEAATSLALHLADRIEDMAHFSDDVLVDDRGSLTVGKKLMEAKKTGYPYIVVVGKRSVEPVPVFEVHDLNGGGRFDLNAAGILQYFKTRST